MADKRVPPDPGGYLEEFHFGPTVWHSYRGKDLYEAEAIEKFNKYASSPKSLDKYGAGRKRFAAVA